MQQSKLHTASERRHSRDVGASLEFSIILLSALRYEAGSFGLIKSAYVATSCSASQILQRYVTIRDKIIAQAHKGQEMSPLSIMMLQPATTTTKFIRVSVSSGILVFVAGLKLGLNKNSHQEVIYKKNY